jgi:hypothetical protein
MKNWLSGAEFGSTHKTIIGSKIFWSGLDVVSNLDKRPDGVAYEDD